MTTHKIILTIVSALLTNGAWASPITMPNTFSSGNVAVVAQVNANFTAIKVAVDANDGNISTNTGSINANSTNIGTNDGRLTTLEADVKNLGCNDNIATSFGNIGNTLTDHGSHISTLENSGGSSIADNPIISVNCSINSLQQAIEHSPLTRQGYY